MSEIKKINENTYKFDDIEISREKHKGKMVWAADGFLTPGQFKEFEYFIENLTKYPTPKMFVPTEADLKRVGSIVSKHLSNDKALVVGKNRIQGQLKNRR